MRKRQWKKILSLVLALAMVFTMNTSVFAAANTEVSAPSAESAAQTEDTTAPAEAQTPAAEPAAEEPAAAPVEESTPAEEPVKEETPAAEENPAQVEAPAEETPVKAAEVSEENQSEEAAGENAAINGWKWTGVDGENSLTYDEGTKVYTATNGNLAVESAGAKDSGFEITAGDGNVKIGSGIDNIDVYIKALDGGTDGYAIGAKDDTQYITLTESKKYQIYVVYSENDVRKKSLISWNDVATRADSGIEAVIKTDDLTKPINADDKGVIDLSSVISNSEAKKIIYSIDDGSTYKYISLPAKTADPSGLAEATENTSTASSIWAKGVADKEYQYSVIEHNDEYVAKYGDFVKVSGNTPNTATEFEIKGLNEDTRYDILYRTAAVEGSSWASKWVALQDESLKTLPVIKASDFKDITVTGIIATVPSSERLEGTHFVVSKNDVVAEDVKSEGVYNFADASTAKKVKKDALGNDLEYDTEYKIFVVDAADPTTAEEVEGATFKTDKDMSKSTWEILTDGSITARSDKTTKPISVYTGISENGAILISANSTEAANIFDGASIVINAANANINRIYVYDGKGSTSNITKVILSGNNISLANQKYRQLKTGSETIDVEEVKTTNTKTLICKEDSTYSIIAKSETNFPKNNTVFEPDESLKVSVSLDDVTITPSEAVTVIEYTNGANKSFTKDTKIPAGAYDV
ncbi:MAG: hypothetical protein J6P45_04900, partial [Lachnospiraceae bacterium]|nr:hypothetical protein [Lachnospiraceae bacterium]